MAALAPLLTLLESSVTCKDVDTQDICRHLLDVESHLNQSPELAPLDTQKAVSVLCSWLRGHEDLTDDECMRLILQTISRLLGQDQATDNLAIQKGLLSATTALLGASVDVAIIRSCLEIIATLSVVENSDTIINRLNSVPMIIEILRKHNDNTALLEDAITTLALMSKRTRHRRAISQSGGVKDIVNLLKMYLNIPSLVVAVCRFLSNFAVKEDCCTAVFTNGGIDALTTAFEKIVAAPGATPTVADMRASVASAIWTCSADSSDVQSSLLASGFLSSLAAVLPTQQKHVSLIEASLGIVRSLCKHSKYKEEVVNLGFINVAARAMKEFPESPVVQKEACGVFGNLSTDPIIRDQLGQSNALHEVVAALQRCHVNDDRKVAKVALGALYNLSSSEANRELLAKTDVIQVTLAAARTFMHNENILEFAIGVVSHLAVQSLCARQIADAGGVEALLLFLTEHREDLQVVSRSIVALRRVVKTSMSAGSESMESTLLQQIVCAGNKGGHHGIQFLVQAMEAHVYDETIVRETALLFSSLAKMPSSIQPLMAMAVQPCMQALEVHQNDAPAADALAGFLALLPLEDDDQWGSAPKNISGATLALGGKSALTSGGYPM
mmetsp:Transcript_126875/g.201152  ORF Transcript_126875/g.201152 Transcript_126875/m.201152 type:complete len:614 (-) Transcript_126875:8-1849(-)